MIERKPSYQRLPRNFHKTFVPERQYIHAMLRFAASGLSGNYQEISESTGIPMGKSSGKVPAILDYCRGMGLIQLMGNKRSSIKEPKLTPFGRIVFLEDPFLKEPITQWIAHFNLCGSMKGADVWFQVFFPGTKNLGMKFSRSRLEKYLSTIYGIQENGKLIGPIVRMYEDEAAFQTCGALTEDKSHFIKRKKAPIKEEFGFGYGAWILQLINDYFPGENQITLTELEQFAGWMSIPSWQLGESQDVIALIESKGILMVDRHMEPWIIHPRVGINETWRRIYDDLL